MIMKKFAVALGLAALAGCVSVLPEARPAAARYLLEPATFDGEGAKVDWSLAVEDPGSTRVYDTPKIAVIRERGRIEYLGASEWADRAPRLLQAAIVRSFENSGRIVAVGDRGSLASSTYILQTDIRGLHADYLGGAPSAKISVYARLANSRGKIFAARLFEHEAEAGRGTPGELAAAFDAAVTATLSEIVEWTYAEGEATRGS